MAVSCATTSGQTSKSGQYRVYFGTYTGGGKSKGIYLSRMDAATGKLTEAELAAETANPSFLAIHPSRKFLYAVGEMAAFGGKSKRLDAETRIEKTGAVSAFAIGADGKLTLLNQVSSGGAGPCHVAVDKTGKCVLVANYSGGSVAALPIQADGKLAEATSVIQHVGSSVNPQRQKGPHAHSINLDAANRFAFAADLGLDKVLVYRLDPDKATLTANDPPSASVKPGAGPRHFAFHPTGKFAYVINEMDCTLTGFSYDAQRGALEELQTVSTLPEGQSVLPAYSTAEVLVHPSGKFVYGSNRGHDTIVVFAIAADGKLTYVEHQPTQGKTPRNFAIDPTGAYLLAENQGSDTVVVFRIDAQTGRLTATGQVVNVPAPVCAKFMPVP